MQTTLNKVKERATEHFMNELKGLDSIDLQRGISLYNSIKSDLVHWAYIKQPSGLFEEKNTIRRSRRKRFNKLYQSYRESRQRKPRIYI